MKSLRIITIALILTWFITQCFYPQFARHFLDSSTFAFLSGWELMYDGSHFMTQLSLFFSVWFMSFCIGMTVSTFIYPVLENKVMTLTKFYKIKKLGE